MADKTVTILKEVYDSLTEDSFRLQTLEESGVDIWDFYGKHQDKFEERMKKVGLGHRVCD